MLWRRVYEVSGGTWERRGAAWTNSVFAYNVSVACNHCADPACAAACPTGAYAIRDDGIVWLDAKKCVGCEYCAWVCPYSAPQYSPELGRTTKCDFCRDLIDAGLPPACVAACPMRALEVVEGALALGPAAAAPPGTRALWEAPAIEHPFPLPAVSRTQPLLRVKPHPAMATGEPKAVANYEEVRRWDRRGQRPGARGQRPGARGQRPALNELPLVAFTLLGQAAAGLAVISLFTQPLSGPILATLAALIAAAALLSLLHLGTALGAWRAPANAKRSALSREIWMLGLFAAALVVALFLPRPGHVALALCGVALVESMTRVYQVDVVPGWKTWRTRAAFAASALLLGSVATLATRLPALGPVATLIVVGASLALIAQQWSMRRRFYLRLSQKVM